MRSDTFLHLSIFLKSQFHLVYHDLVHNKRKNCKKAQEKWKKKWKSGFLDLNFHPFPKVEVENMGK